MMDLFVYYKSDSKLAASLQLQVMSMQSALTREHRVAACLKRRPTEQNGQFTWMEVYKAVPEGFDVLLEQAVTQAGLAALIDGPRHIERFMDVSLCA